MTHLFRLSVHGVTLTDLSCSALALGHAAADHLVLLASLCTFPAPPSAGDSLAPSLASSVNISCVSMPIHFVLTIHFSPRSSRLPSSLILSLSSYPTFTTWRLQSHIGFAPWQFLRCALYSLGLQVLQPSTGNSAPLRSHAL